MNRYAVAWSRETNRLCMLTMDELCSVNASALLDDKPGLAVIRMHCSEDDARRYIRAHAALMARRSVERLDNTTEVNG